MPRDVDLDPCGPQNWWQRGLGSAAESVDARDGRAMSRKVADCRDFPSESGCTLTIAGEHAVSVHGHQPGPDLEAGIRATLKDEALAG